jgi:hydrogenase maturation factor
MLMIVNHEAAENLIQQIRTHADGKNAAIIGKVTPFSSTKLILNTSIGGRRRVPWPEALNLPRIC